MVRTFSILSGEEDGVLATLINFTLNHALGEVVHFIHFSS